MIHVPTRSLGAVLVSLGVLGSVACATTEEPPSTPDGAVEALDGGPPPTPPADGARPDGSPDAPPPKECTKPEDCPSRVCDLAKGLCVPPTCKDGALNQDETDTDCGGATCAACDVQKRCKGGADCTTKVCTGGVCAAATCTDLVENGVESDKDCGGAVCGRCLDGLKCKTRDDCISDVCTGGTCATPTCSDGAKNGSDTDVDCGGPACPRCTDGQTCLVAGDCESSVCADTGTGLRCQPPSCTDSVKNGGETDTDCGGACPGCGVGQACLVGADCKSQGCNYDQKCAAGRSCLGHYGGDTCGFGGEGSVGPAQWEDCCTTAPVTVAGAQVELDKYPVTAGRMRAFLESVGYDVRGFVRAARAAGKVPTAPGIPAGGTVLDPGWDLYLPTSFAGNQNAGELMGCAQRDCLPEGDRFCACQPGTETRGLYTAVSRHVGGFIFNGNSQTSTGCFVGSPGTHAFRFPDNAQDGARPEAGQDIYDTKAMNCVDYLVGQAFCVWDGGRLETLPEWQAAFGPDNVPPWQAVEPRDPLVPQARGLTNGSLTYWGCRFPWATDASHAACALDWDGTAWTLEYAAYQYSYEYPKLVGSDYIVFISAPGRTRGRGAGGHSDLIGNNFELTSTLSTFDGTDPFTTRHRWSGNGSWEVHNYSRSGGGTTMLLNKYGKLGLRCAHP